MARKTTYRILVALTIACLGTLPFVATALGPDRPSSATALVLPPVQEGDRFAYTLSWPGEEDTELVLAYEGPQAVHLQDATFRAASVMRKDLYLRFDSQFTDGPDGPFRSTYAFDDDGHVLLAREARGWSQGGGSVGFLPLLGLQQSETTTAWHYDVGFADSGHASCPLRAPGQALALPFTGSFAIPGCGDRLWSYAGADGGRHVWSTGSDEGTSSMAFQPDVALPAWIRHMQGSGERATVAQAVLTGADRGEVAAIPEVPSPTRVVAPATAPFGRMGPDAAGFPHDWTREEALDVLLRHPDGAEVQRYVQDHPDWFLSSAAYERYPSSSGGGPQSWNLVFDSEGAPVSAWIIRWTPGPLAGTPAPALPVLAAFGERYTVHTHRGWLDLPHDTARPASAPTAAGVLASWEAYRAHEPRDDVRGWGFSLACAATQAEPDVQERAKHGAAPRATGGRCDALELRVWAGDYASGSASEGGLDPATSGTSEEKEWDRMALIVDGAGRIVGRHESDVHYERRAEGALAQPPAPKGEAAPGLKPVSAGAFPDADSPVGRGITAVSLAGSLLYLAWPTVKSGALGLFSRVSGPRLLQHPTRRLVADCIEANPGIHYKELSRRLGLANGTLEHHLRKLVADGIVLRHAGDGYTCYFPKGVSRHDLRAAGPLKAAGARRVLQAVQASPGASSSDVATAAGLDASTVSHHVRRLQDAGLVEARRVGRTVRLHPRVGAAGS
ncbi:MAG TPA: winged helix-turn-helix transcriptional regulator [Candidatus Thermoplasmatota archaeon]|nr:winged helix-turn-helix transcriptional regulator [Candidatus Thermoplasmatota archaeon]